jgi:hypothetical protein
MIIMRSFKAFAIMKFTEIVYSPSAIVDVSGNNALAITLIKVIKSIIYFFKSC